VLRCFRVSSSRLPGSLPWGSRPCVPKGAEGEVEDTLALISCVLTHLQHPHSTPPIPAYSPPHHLAHQPSSTGLPIAYLHPVYEQSLRSQLRHNLGGPSAIPWAWDNRHDIAINTSPPSSPSFPSPPHPPRRWDISTPSIPTALQGSSTSPVSSIFIGHRHFLHLLSWSSCSIIRPLWLSLGSLCTHAPDTTVMSNGLVSPFVGILFGFVCRGLGLFLFVWCTLLVLL